MNTLPNPVLAETHAAWTQSGISGYVIVRNGISLDYCFAEAIASLLPVCNEVVVCDSDSTDGTREALDALAASDDRIRIINRPWPAPRGQPTWFVEWINWTRMHLRHEFQLQLDADEVLGEQAHDAIRWALSHRQCLWFKRLNFWRDPQHIAQSGEGGVGVGDGVARFGLSSMYMPSDEPHPEGEPLIRIHSYPTRAHPDPTLLIYHYGFLRRNDAFIDKARVCLETFFATKDERVERAAREGVSWMTHVSFDKPLLDYTGTHPAVALPWLRAHGYVV